MNKKEFLNKYFKDKKEWHRAGNCLAGNDFYNVIMCKQANTGVIYCVIESFELGIMKIAEFIVPEKYEDFKTVMDIFLK